MKPANKQSKSEARENGRKGGINSGKKRAEKKGFQEAAKWALEMGTTVSIKGEQLNITQAQAIVLNLLQKAANKDDKQSIEAAKVLIQLSGANKSEAEVKVLEAQARMIQAKADLLTGADTSTLDKLDDILREMKDNADIKPETE